MNEWPNTLHERQVHLGRRAVVVAVVTLVALLLFAALASLAQASVAVLALPEGRAVVPPVITNPVITETSAYLHAEGTTLYYGDEMGLTYQLFWLGGDAEGTELDYIECTAAFGDGPFTDDTPADGWQCGTDADTYDLRSLSNGDGVITATLYNTTGTIDTEPFYYIEDLADPDSAASSPQYANSLPIMVGWVATDTESGVAETCLSAKYEGDPWDDTGLCQAGLAGTFAFTIGGAEDGTYYFQSVAIDNVGNQEAALPGDGDTETLLDTAVPLATVDAPATTLDSSWLVEWSATDPAPGSGIDVYDVFYRVDAGGWTAWLQGVTDTSATFGPTSPVTVRAGHSYSFYVRAYDKAGNYTDSAVVTTEVGFKPLHVPLIMRSYAPLTNGGFELGWAGWTHGGELPQSISTADTHSGSYAALLGSPAYPCEGPIPLGRAWIQGTISVPSGATDLRVWYRIWSQDQLAGALFDRFEIWLNGSLELRDGDPDDEYGCEYPPQSVWEYYDIDVAAYAGQNVTLRLENWNWADEPLWPDADIYNTWTYVDDIEFLP
jgi:hypothetical protein